MINTVTFNNFRCFDEFTVPLSSVTMLTGVNGVGKTTILEGLFCLFSETKLDVSLLTRYHKSTCSGLYPTPNATQGVFKKRYNYKMFWDECPYQNENKCSVSAVSENRVKWTWEYKKSKLYDMDSNTIANFPIPVDDSTEFADWVWHRSSDYNPYSFTPRVQILTSDGGLYLFPNLLQTSSICKYLDFSTERTQPFKLSFNIAKELTKALSIIEPRITDVRLIDNESGLSVVLDNAKEISLEAVGNGAVTWANILLEIFSTTEKLNGLPQPGGSRTDPQLIEYPVFILLDEIGVGIHYSIMNDIWKYFYEFSKHNSNVQFVFSSHSDDCIRAFCETFLNQDSASVIRLHKTVTDNKIKYTKYENGMFRNIVDGDWEVRG